MCPKPAKLVLTLRLKVVRVRPCVALALGWASRPRGCGGAFWRQWTADAACGPGGRPLAPPGVDGAARFVGHHWQVGLRVPSGRYVTLRAHVGGGSCQGITSRHWFWGRRQSSSGS